MHRPLLALGIGALALGLSSAAAAAGKAHEHGALRLDVAVEATSVTLQLQAPLDSLVGFERAPRTEAERQRVDQALARLKAAAQLFRVDPKGQCTAGPVLLTSGVLKLGDAPPPPDVGDHAELEAGYRFDCRSATDAAFIDHGLFEAFARAQRIDVQIAGPKGQARRGLKRPAARIGLAR